VVKPAGRVSRTAWVSVTRPVVRERQGWWAWAWHLVQAQGRTLLARLGACSSRGV